MKKLLLTAMVFAVTLTGCATSPPPLIVPSSDKNLLETKVFKDGYSRTTETLKIEEAIKDNIQDGDFDVLRSNIEKLASAGNKDAIFLMHGFWTTEKLVYKDLNHNEMVNLADQILYLDKNVRSEKYKKHQDVRMNNLIDELSTYGDPEAIKAKWAGIKTSEYARNARLIESYDLYMGQAFIDMTTIALENKDHQALLEMARYHLGYWNDQFSVHSDQYVREQQANGEEYLNYEAWPFLKFAKEPFNVVKIPEDLIFNALFPSYKIEARDIARDAVKKYRDVIEELVVEAKPSPELNDYINILIEMNSSLFASSIMRKETVEARDPLDHMRMLEPHTSGAVQSSINDFIRYGDQSIAIVNAIIAHKIK